MDEDHEPRIEGEEVEGTTRDSTKRLRSASPSLPPSDSPRPSKRPRSSSPPSKPDRTPSPSDTDSPPLFIISLSPSQIVPDSHYASFGLGFSYSYFPPSNPLSTSLEILGETQSLPPPPTTTTEEEEDRTKDPAAGQILNHLMIKKSCYNCSSPDHSLNQCPFRRDQNEIAKNRELFQSNSSISSSYHRLSDSRDDPRLNSNAPSSERQRFLSYHSSFVPGVVSSTLRQALGLAAEGEGYTTEELPWTGRIREYGYPSGWTWIDGEMNPLEKSRRVIECRRGEGDNEWEWGEVGVLDMYDDEGEETDKQEGKEEITKQEGIKSTPLLPSDDDPPPLPPGSPPPLPPGPPPPPPPAPEETTRKIHRLVDYRTYLFDSNTQFLSFSPDRYYASFNKFSVKGKDEGRKKDDGVNEAMDGDGEEEMDFGDSSDEGN